MENNLCLSAAHTELSTVKHAESEELESAFPVGKTQASSSSGPSLE